MKFLKELFRYFVVVDKENKRRESPASPVNKFDEKTSELTREQLAEILQWLSYY